MADQKISQLPELLTPSPFDIVPIVNDGTTKKIALSSIQQTTINPYIHANFVPLSGDATISRNLTLVGDLSTGGNLTVTGNLSVQGSITQIDTQIASTSAMYIDTNSSETALRITQRGSGDVLRVEDSANVDTTPFIIKTDGKVGIGTASPNEVLTVVGNVSAQGDLTVTGNLSVQGSITQIDTQIASTSAMYIDTNSSETALRITQRGSGDVLRVEDSANVDTTPFIINSDGNVGIGTATPLSGLHVVGGTRLEGSVAEGSGTVVSGTMSHAEGQNSSATGSASHAEGYQTTASGNYAHAEGDRSTASGSTSHAEGLMTTASGTYSHSEGRGTTASGDTAHAEGGSTQAIGGYSHAAGIRSVANNTNSWIWRGMSTASLIAPLVSTTRSGQFMVSAEGGSAFFGNVGINTDNKDNALTVVGNVSAQGDLTVTGNLSVQGSITQIDTQIASTSAMYIDTNSSETALRITQRGSGDVLRVEDSANVDTTPFIINNEGRVGIGTASPNEVLTVVGNISAQSTEAVFTGNLAVSGSIRNTLKTDIPVALPTGRSFGRYVNGDIIPATGKTLEEVLRMAAAQPLDPTVSLTTASTVAFNQTSISNILNFSYTINSLNPATVESVSLQWRRNNTGTWTVLSTNTGISTFTHNFTDTNFNTQPINYRYIVTDTLGASTTATRDITPAAYVAPTITLTVVGNNLSAPLESNSSRERGNVSSTISGTITRQSANVNLTNYQLQYRVNSGSWTNIGSAVSISGSSASIASTVHNPTADAATASTIDYRVVVTDAFGTTNSSTSTVTFNYVVFYGPVATVPTNSSGVRNLPTKIFASSITTGELELNTGTTLTNFTVALPTQVSNRDTISSAIDLDALYAPLTYVINTFAVNDYSGNSSSYNVYTLSISIPYTSNHRHKITLA